MLTAESIQKMKQNNISVNGELTKERTKEVLKSATRAQKNDIDALAGLKRVSINRVYTTGSISAKIAVAIAQTMNVDPFYLTGDKDEHGECTDMTLDAFLIDKGYSELSKLSSSGKKPRKQYTRKAKEQTIPNKQPATTEQFAADDDDISERLDREARSRERCTTTMSEEEAVQLLRAKYLLVQFTDGPHEELRKIQVLLL